MLTLLVLLVFESVFGVYVTPIKQIKKCKMLTYTPPSLFQFGQQIFWDSRINSIYVADADAPNGSPSIIRFDWKSRTFYSASITNTDNTEPVSFVVPAASSSDTLIAGHDPCISRLNWNGVSSTATRIDDIACRCPEDSNSIDRGATTPNGTLYMSIIPSTHCNKTISATFPAAAVVYLKRGSLFPQDVAFDLIANAVTPGTYSNGIVFDSKTDKFYIADDCSGTVFAFDWNPTKKSLTNSKPVFKFPRDKAITNYPSGMVIDQCSNFYVGDHNSGLVYYVQAKTGNVLKKYSVPGTHPTAVGIVGTNLDYLCVLTGIPYHDIYGNSESNSTNPGDGKMYLIPISMECSDYDCKGKPGVPVAGF